VETISLTDPGSRIGFFQQTILANLHYWQDWLEHKIDDVVALDRERNGLLKAISFALDLEALAWSATLQLINGLAPYMEQRGYWDSWSRVLNRASQVAQYLEDEAALANLLGLKARLLYRQSHFKASEAAYRHVIRLVRRLGDQFGEGRACTNLGYYYIERGHLLRAEVLCRHALTLFERLQNQHGLAHTENHLGVLYIWQCRWGEAQQHLQRACANWEARNDASGLMRGYLNLGWLFNEMQQPEEAMIYLGKALEQARHTGDELTVGIVYLNMGMSFLLGGAFTKAEAYTRQAEMIMRRFSASFGLANAFENLGLIYLEQQNWLEASSFLQRALELWQALDNKYGQIQSKTYLAEAELLGGSRREAQAQFHELQGLLEKFDPRGVYGKLQTQMNKLRHHLPEEAAGGGAVSQVNKRSYSLTPTA
jgi:tetratricopeptide (TPR) repeat protein